MGKYVVKTDRSDLKGVHKRKNNSFLAIIQHNHLFWADFWDWFCNERCEHKPASSPKDSCFLQTSQSHWETTNINSGPKEATCWKHFCWEVRSFPICLLGFGILHASHTTHAQCQSENLYKLASLQFAQVWPADSHSHWSEQSSIWSVTPAQHRNTMPIMAGGLILHAAC